MAAGSTYTPLATQTGNGSATSLTFTSIPSTYTDLIIIANSGTVAAGNIQIQFNGDTGSNYSATLLYGTGSTAASARYTNLTEGYMGGGAASSPTTLTTTAIAHINNYSNSTTYKTVISRYGNAAAETNSFVSLWRSTAAITSIRLFSYSSAYLTGSTFTLYGIAAA
jgi:hypothetical protein